MEKKIGNPFNITFGEEPKSFIPRDAEASQILNSFDSESPESKIYVITGPRGSGKTVFLSQIKRIYDEKEDWITIDLNPHGNMIEQFCAKAYEKGKVKRLFLETEFNYSFHGFGISISGGNPVSNVESMVEKILVHLAKKGIRVLLTIDDVTNGENMRYFAHAFQSYIREGYGVFLLMTGLHDNISDLQNDKGLTFLIRAPKIHLDRLSQVAIANSYIRVLGVDKEKAIALATTTMGYAYGYQLLGNLLYKSGGDITDETMAKFDTALDANVYSLIWRGLSKKDRQILIAVADGNTEVSALLLATGMKNSALQVYKGRLDKAGLLDISQHGHVSLALPRLKEYILMQKEFED